VAAPATTRVNVAAPSVLRKTPPSTSPNLSVKVPPVGVPEIVSVCTSLVVPAFPSTVVIVIAGVAPPVSDEVAIRSRDVALRNGPPERDRERGAGQRAAGDVDVADADVRERLERRLDLGSRRVVRERPARARGAAVACGHDVVLVAGDDRADLDLRELVGRHDRPGVAAVQRLEEPDREAAAVAARIAVLEAEIAKLKRKPPKSAKATYTTVVATLGAAHQGCAPLHCRRL